jgi:nucleotide-binding universal stress UspA family protein
MAWRVSLVRHIIMGRPDVEPFEAGQRRSLRDRHHGAAKEGNPAMPLERFRNIFVPVSPDREGRLPAAVDYALSLAEPAKMHVTFHLMGQLFEAPYTMAPGFVGSLTGPANAEEKARLAKAEGRLRRRMAAADMPYGIESHQLPHATHLARAVHQARLHDLTIADAPIENLAFGRALAEELLFNTGRPLICVPAGARTFKASRILVAWDGTARAARALNDAITILANADHVEIVSITNEKDLTKLVPGTEVAPQLARHGVAVDVVALSPVHGDAGEALRERAALAGIDMIVMGAFAHSRWRQMILGGVTDSMFEKATVPVFMSH